ncbi:MAG: magnesium transporter MgtC [Desulfuromonas sp.]|jgi:putative Mg2+ transporter-C (MgtC) family protein|nr:MAG: magnesium transporter MgtC [Desulfuromonas sp.]
MLALTYATNTEWFTILLHLVMAMVAGGLIGLERSYHGRPAGFRTHTLVCIASSLLMLVTMYQDQWFGATALEVVRIDPTRMAQGIMTGIGFLGAGVIMKSGLNVRGLTTAASIWITAAIGILAGVGLYSALIIASILTLLTLTVFRKIEVKMPTQIFAHHTVVFSREKYLSESEIRALLSQNGFSAANISYKFNAEKNQLNYRMTARTMDEENIEKLARNLMNLSSVVEFDISMVED